MSIPNAHSLCKRRTPGTREGAWIKGLTVPTPYPGTVNRHDQLLAGKQCAYPLDQPVLPTAALMRPNLSDVVKHSATNLQVSRASAIHTPAIRKLAWGKKAFACRVRLKLH
jgi:hypothetical protein